MKTPTTLRPPLQSLIGIRFLAALHVVFHHHLILTPGFRQAAPSWLQRLIAAAPGEVTMFFVVSGFVLAYNYLDLESGLTVSRKDFWQARIARLYPMYLIALVAYFPIAVARYATGTGTSVIDVGPGPTFFISGILTLLFLQSWSVIFTAWNPPCWSVSTEVFFYSFFPWAAQRLKSLSTNRLLLVSSLLWIASLIVPAYFVLAVLGRCSQQTNDLWEITLRIHPVLRASSFLIGITTAIVFLRQRHRPHAMVPWLVNGTVIVILALFAFVPTSAGRLLENGLTVLFAMLVYLLALGRGSLSRLLSHPVMVLLGEASYAMYLLHTPLWNYFARRHNAASILLHGHLPVGHPVPGAVTEWNRQLNMTEFVIYLAVLVGISVLALLYVERPMRLFLKRRFERRKPLAAARLAASAS